MSVTRWWSQDCPKPSGDLKQVSFEGGTKCGNRSSETDGVGRRVNDPDGNNLLIHMFVGSIYIRGALWFDQSVRRHLPTVLAELTGMITVTIVDRFELIDMHAHAHAYITVTGAMSNRNKVSE